MNVPSTSQATALNLLFHIVAPAPPPGGMTPGAFGDLLESLQGQGLKAARLSDYPGRPPGPECFTISFDDAHPSLIEHALPILREFGLPATVFVPTAYAGETAQVLSYEELGRLTRLPGWSLGAHGHRHTRAGWREYKEDPSALAARLRQDYSQARDRMAKHLGRAPRLLAYPFGEAPGAARVAAMQAGYAAAFTVDQQALWDGTPWAIPRLDACLLDPEARQTRCPYAPDAPPAFSVIVPACGRPALLREVVSRLCRQSYPEERFEIIIIDDGSSEDLAEALNPWIARIRLKRLEGSDERFRAGQARQAGADCARHAHLVFLDADVAVDEDFLWHLAWSHASTPGAVVLGYLSGYNLHDLGYVHTLDEVRLHERLTADRLPLIPDRSREPALAACLDNIEALDEPWRLAYTGNLSLPKELLERAGGFADAFSGWGFEDVDLGLRLHEAGARWVFSRFALGYHLADPDTGRRPSNPFRDDKPRPEKFAGVLQNLETLERLHAGDPRLSAFCEGLRADVAEICSRPATVGVECGADYPFAWPFRRLHQAHPGGVSLEAICDRLAYARKVGAEGVYLLGGDVLLRPDLLAVLECARLLGLRWISAETSGWALAERGVARSLRQAGLTGLSLEVLAGERHPSSPLPDRVMLGMAAARQAELIIGGKLVLGVDEPAAFERGCERLAALGVALEQLVVLDPASERWLPEELKRRGLSEVDLLRA